MCAAGQVSRMGNLHCPRVAAVQSNSGRLGSGAMGTTLQVTTADGTAEAYLTGEPGKPGVLFYIDAIGLRPQIEEMADRIASWGYTVLAPNVLYRSGTAAETSPAPDQD